MKETKTDIALKRFNQLLESKYDLHIEDSTADHLRFIKEYYGAQKKQFSANDSRYAKAYLISEVARLMLLREIQPRPTGKRKRVKQ